MPKYSISSFVFVLAIAASGCCCFDRVYRPGCSDCCDSGLAPDCGGCGSGCVGCALCQQTRNQLTSCAGCGDVYWGEWLSDPPDACDPCDGCGNWVGPRCCPPRLFDFLTCSVGGLWGSRCGDGGCCDDGGCSSCGGGGSNGLEPWEGVEFEEGYYHPQPHKSGEPRKAAPIPQPQPSSPAPETLETPTGSQAVHERSPRSAPPKSLKLQPTRAKQLPPPRSASKSTRPRSL